MAQIGTRQRRTFVRVLSAPIRFLSLLSNAVLVWNTVRMTEILAQLGVAGETIPAKYGARISFLAYTHAILNGIYHLERPLAAVEEVSHALA